MSLNSRPIWPLNPRQNSRVHLTELETPALVVDLDIMESNIEAMAAHCKASGVGLRPHIKTHKTPAIANKQIAAGAVGICSSTLGEAEVMAAAGVADILVTRPVVGRTKIARLCGLNHHARVQVVTDSVENVDELASVADALETKLTVLMEVNVGQNRGGVDPVSNRALELARHIAGKKRLMLGGIQAYEGHLVLNPDPSVRDSKTPLANRAGRETKEMIERSGIACPTLSGGGTGTYTFTGSREAGYTELQAGSYVTMDARYSAQMGDTPFGPALSLLSTCIGRPTADRVILDAGQKVVSVEFGPPIVRSHRTMKYLSGVGGDEHGVVMREGEDDVNVGDLVELVPTHGCTAFNLHDWVYGVRNGYVEVIWPVAARGCSW